ncbi:hypothetical protein [Tianweitania sp.]|uniref:hypothetical protein n=1 Tax=Tianweitania sp. TaxID=2021634 RepID=UPI00289BDA6F|nr:hypothetical protein [Tianweitania sp.]
MRQLLDDRWAGGMAAALTAAFVLVQVLLSAFLCASNVLVSSERTTVICHGTSTTTIVSHHDGEPPSPLDHACPCGTLCGVGVAVLAPIPADAGIYAWTNAVDIDFIGNPGERLVLRFSGAPPFPTGPPSLSA